MCLELQYELLSHNRTTQRVALNADVKAVLRCVCGAVGVVVKEDIGNGQVMCPGCTKSYCVLCGNESHVGKPCPPPKETVGFYVKYFETRHSTAVESKTHGSHSISIPLPRQLKWLDKKSNKVTRCPNCGNAIQKAGGCDHMTCRPPGGCGHEFWFSCGCDFAKPHTCGKRNTASSLAVAQVAAHLRNGRGGGGNRVGGGGHGQWMSTNPFALRRARYAMQAAQNAALRMGFSSGYTEEEEDDDDDY